MPLHLEAVAAELHRAGLRRLDGTRGFPAAAAPDVLVADEPTSRLDEPNARAVAGLLRRLAHERGAAVLVASHDPVVVEQADERVALG